MGPVRSKKDGLVHLHGPEDKDLAVQLGGIRVQPRTVLPDGTQPTTVADLTRPYAWYFSPLPEPLTVARDRLARRLATVREVYADVADVYAREMKKLVGQVVNVDDIDRIVSSACLLAYGCPRNSKERKRGAENYKVIRKHYRISHNASLAKVAEVVDRIAAERNLPRTGGAVVLWFHFTRND